MTDKKVFFLSGLPRTGSTLLGSILAQNPRIHVTPTSPLYPLLVSTNECFNLCSVQYTYNHEEISNRVYHAIVDAFFDGIPQPIVFDKHRGWPKHSEAIKQFINPTPRIIATVRPIAEILTSYLKLAENDPNNFIDAHLEVEKRPHTNEERALLLWTTYLRSPYEALKEGLITHPENILLVDYWDIVFDPEKTLDKVYDFCGIEPPCSVPGRKPHADNRFKHTFDNIKNLCAEAKDDAWGLKDLHTIRSKLSMQSAAPLAFLPQAAIDYFGKFDIGGAA